MSFGEFDLPQPLTGSITPINDRVTNPYMTTFEYDTLKATRSSQLDQGYPPKISIPDNITDTVKIAERELKAYALDLIVRRELPSGYTENIPANELLLPYE